MNYDNKEEMFPIVDEQGNITGAATRGCKTQRSLQLDLEVNCYIR